MHSSQNEDKYKTILRKYSSKEIYELQGKIESYKFCMHFLLDIINNSIYARVVDHIFIISVAAYCL